MVHDKVPSSFLAYPIHDCVAVNVFSPNKAIVGYRDCTLVLAFESVYQNDLVCQQLMRRSANPYHEMRFDAMEGMDAAEEHVGYTLYTDQNALSVFSDREEQDHLVIMKKSTLSVLR
jgi:hypothetical protein